MLKAGAGLEQEQGCFLRAQSLEGRQGGWIWWKDPHGSVTPRCLSPDQTSLLILLPYLTPKVSSHAPLSILVLSYICAPFYPLPPSSVLQPILPQPTS